MARGGSRLKEAAAQLPVARVVVDQPLPHLDRPFDYLIPAELDRRAVPGCRVRVRFARRLMDGFLLERVAQSAHPGQLAFIERVVSAEPVLTPEIAALARAVADRYAGTLADVLRLAIPPRHARVEAEPVRPGDGTQPSGAGDSGWDDSGWDVFPGGREFLAELTAGGSPRAVLTVLPGENWPQRLAGAIMATVRSGRGAIAVVPDARDLDRLDAALGSCGQVALHAALGPAERYRRFLRASRGQTSVVIGTRAAAFAPVRNLGLVAIWDDGDDLHAEPRAPYPHALPVLLLRAQSAGAGALVAATARSTDAQLLLETRWATEIVATRDTVRARAPAVAPAGDDADRARDPAAVTARLPSIAWQAARDALAAGAPVLVQTPRQGYLPAVSCGRCGAPARCAHCAGPLQISRDCRQPAPRSLALTAMLPSPQDSGPASAVAACRWCGRPAADYTCGRCGARRPRAAVVGAARTADELGRAFPGVPVRTSGGDSVLDTVPGGPSLVVATPGAEPRADGGYGAVLLLDTWALLGRADLRAGEETLRRWMAAATLARPAPEGRVVVVADGALLPVQALLRWDPGTFARRELAERRELGFPPAARMASLTGPASAVSELLALAALPEGSEVLGPVPLPAGGPGEAGEASFDGEPQERVLVRVPSRSAGAALAAALHRAASIRSAKKAPGTVRIQIDPRDLG